MSEDVNIAGPVPAEELESFQVLQRDVQRLLGRCMLRLQQYERLMKALLIEHEIKTDTLSNIASAQSRRHAVVSNKSLGMLVNELFESYVVAPSGNGGAKEDPDDAFDEPAFGFKAHMELSVDELEKTKGALRELVELRNRLVHHFIEDFDLWTQAGCLAANEFLHNCYARIEQRMQELRSWAQAVVTAKEHAAAYWQSTEFQDLVLFGIHPDGRVDWEYSGVVRGLVEAATLHCSDGWTRLSDAVRFFEQKCPELTPEKYGCKGWPHLLHESRQFQLLYRLEADGSRVAWYRDRAGT